MPSAFDGYLPREKVETKVVCTFCNGAQTVGPAKSAEGDWLDQPCPKCDGRGWLKVKI